MDESTTEPGSGPVSTLINSWTEAYNYRNTLLYLPREIRDQIYDEVVGAGSDEKSEKLYGSKKLKKSNKLNNPLFQTNRLLREESLPIFIRNQQWIPTENNYNFLTTTLPTVGGLPDGLRAVRSIELSSLMSGDRLSAVLTLSCPLLAHLTFVFGAEVLCNPYRHPEEILVEWPFLRFLSGSNLKTLTLTVRYYSEDLDLDKNYFWDVADFIMANIQQSGKKVKVKLMREWVDDWSVQYLIPFDMFFDDREISLVRGEWVKDRGRVYVHRCQGVGGLGGLWQETY